MAECKWDVEDLTQSLRGGRSVMGALHQGKPGFGKSDSEKTVRTGSSPQLLGV